MPPSAAGTRLLARAAMHTPHSSNPAQSKKKSGADDPIRTDDLLITSELLYQLSYVGSGCRGGVQRTSHPRNRAGSKKIPPGSESRHAPARDARRARLILPNPEWAMGPRKATPLGCAGSSWFPVSRRLRAQPFASRGAAPCLRNFPKLTVRSQALGERGLVPGPPIDRRTYQIARNPRGGGRCGGATWSAPVADDCRKRDPRPTPGRDSAGRVDLRSPDRLTTGKYTLR